MAEVQLTGCASMKLASYLKAIAVLRLVSEQLDKAARGYWTADGLFTLQTTKTAEEIVDFFLHHYRPTPIVTPWNGGSGFNPKDQQSGIQAIEESSHMRFAVYRQTISVARALVGAHEAGDSDERTEKRVLLERCRSELPDEAVLWLDAAFSIGESPSYAALLGTGGNDGRLEFANNFMQRIAELFLTQAQKPKRGPSPRLRLESALFNAQGKDVLVSLAYGQFGPSNVGGVNMGEGFVAETRANPWDFIFALEGSILFAGAAVRRLEHRTSNIGAFPFQVSLTNAGYAAPSDPDADNSRAELWLPVWSAPTSLHELKILFGEGRLQVGKRAAHNGLDALRAVRSLGVDRGVDRFRRVAFLKRNGLAFLATSQGEFPVSQFPHLALLEDFQWYCERLDALNESPPSIRLATRRLKDAMMSAARTGEPRKLTACLREFGRLVRTHRTSRKAKESGVKVPRLSAEWLRVANDRSPEFEFAAAVSSCNLGTELVLDSEDRLRDPWVSGRMFESLFAIARTRLRAALAAKGSPLFTGTSSFSRPESMSACLRPEFDDRRAEDLIFALSQLVSAWPLRTPQMPLMDEGAFWVLRAALSPVRGYVIVPTNAEPDFTRDRPTKDLLTLLSLVERGDIVRALQIAERRLHIKGIRTLGPIRSPSDVTRPVRYGVALLLPLDQEIEERMYGRYFHSVSYRKQPSQQKDTRND